MTQENKRLVEQVFKFETSHEIDKVLALFAAEVRQAFEHIGMILQHAGAGFENIVELQSFHVSDNMSVDNQVFIRVRAEFIPGPHPAWTSYGIRSLALPDARVEIKALAVLPNY